MRVLLQHKSERGLGRNGRQMTSLLEVQDLHVAYRSREGIAFQALTGVDFQLMPGEILGVLGESGSGKSTLAASLLRLLPENGQITTGKVLLEGKDILQVSLAELQRIRGSRISLIFQEPSLALHPTMRAGEQVRQVLAAHESQGRRALRERTREVVATLFPEEVERISRAYPHQLSGGQRQRVLIAQAIACSPSLIIADEPTASLDPTTQMEILGVFRSLREKMDLGMIFITHSPALLAGFADRVLVLYAGRVVELGTAATVLSSPQHPYTKALLRSVPPPFEQLESGNKSALPAILGDSLPSSLPSQGCPFEPRCAERMDICTKREPELARIGDAQAVSCLKFET
jgi:oligopeptide/dipeptide ABC transporter ATP-binding protein